MLSRGACDYMKVISWVERVQSINTTDLSHAILDVNKTVGPIDAIESYSQCTSCGNTSAVYSTTEYKSDFGVIQMDFSL